MLKDKGSSFKAFCLPVSTIEELITFQSEVKNLPLDKLATHHILAYILDTDAPDVPAISCVDDGEHKAGGKILNPLKQHHLKDIAIIVCRWYGGTHLGPTRVTHIISAADSALTKMGLLAVTNINSVVGPQQATTEEPQHITSIVNDFRFPPNRPQRPTTEEPQHITSVVNGPKFPANRPQRPTTEEPQHITSVVNGPRLPATRPAPQSGTQSVDYLILHDSTGKNIDTVRIFGQDKCVKEWCPYTDLAANIVKRYKITKAVILMAAVRHGQQINQGSMSIERYKHILQNFIRATQSTSGCKILLMTTLAGDDWSLATPCEAINNVMKQTSGDGVIYVDTATAISAYPDAMEGVSGRDTQEFWPQES